MSEAESVRQQVIASVIAAAVLGALGWIASLLLPVAEWLRYGSIAVPGWVVAVVALVAAGVAGWRWQLRRQRRRQSRLAGAAGSMGGLEVVPIAFELDLSRDVPRVDVTLRAINYREGVLSLREVTVRRLTFESGPALDTIPLRHDVEIPGGTSRVVYCGRALMDTEARAVLGSGGHRIAGGVSLTARGIVYGAEVQFSTSDQVILGQAVAPSA